MIACLKLFRLPFVFTAMADSAAGYLLAHCRGGVHLAPPSWHGSFMDAREADVQWMTMVLVALSSAGLYAFGMALNDIIDVEKDRVSAPWKILPSGRMSMGAAWAAALGGLAVSGAAIATVPGAAILRLGIWAALLFFIVAYDTLLKFAPVMGMVRALNFGLGVSLVPLAMTMESPYVVPGLVALFAYAAVLTVASKQEEGKACRGMVVVCAVLMGMSALLAVSVRKFHIFYADSLTGFLPAALLAAWLLFRAFGARDRAHVKLFVRDGVGGILLLDAAMLMAAGLIPAGLVVAALVVPAALGVMVLRRV